MLLLLLLLGYAVIGSPYMQYKYEYSLYDVFHFLKKMMMIKRARKV